MSIKQSLKVRYSNPYLVNMINNISSIYFKVVISITEICIKKYILANKPINKSYN